MEIDTQELRKKIKDYYGTASFNGFPTAMIDLEKIDCMSNDEALKLAKIIGIDGYKHQK